jgi:hypothetical protein
MKLIKSKKASENYLSKIVKIETFRKHNDPEVTKLKCCAIDGFNIITGIDSKPGLYIYFPVLSQINSDFLSFANLYRHKELNKDPEQSGMFEDNGRVKAIKLRGELSEGFIIPITIFENYIISVTNKELENVKENTEFDAIEHNGKEFWISKKYLPKRENYEKQSTGNGKIKKVSKRYDRVIDTQFRYHYNTVVIKKCPFVLTPNSIIQISGKIHGTSGISAYVLCHKKLSLKEKIAKWLTGNQFDAYDYLYSSRTVIKNKYYNKEITDGYYGIDVWAEADKIVKPHLEKGQIAYYEIVGFLPTGAYIQKNYDYGCVAPKKGEKYTPEKHFKVRIYRITYTNVDGDVLEYTTHQVQQWCEKTGLIPVKEYYYGKAKDLYPELNNCDNWNECFIDKLANDANFNMEQLSPDCNNKVPHEGIVIKIEDGMSRAFKLKSFAFINKEQQALDKGEENIEDEN